MKQFAVVAYRTHYTFPDSNPVLISRHSTYKLAERKMQALARSGFLSKYPRISAGHISQFNITQP